jgi:hypothetical protein
LLVVLLAGGVRRVSVNDRPELDELDLVSQTCVALSTRRLLDALLWRKWFQTDL